MVKVKMYKQVQNLKRQGYSLRMIARELRLNRRTVAKYYSMNEEEYRSYRESNLFREKVLLRYKDEILAVYERNEFKKLNMSSLYDYLEERFRSLPCNEQTLRNFIGYLVKTDKLEIKDGLRTYSQVPQLPLGKQMQLDFGQYRCSSGLKLYIFVAVLSASRYKYIVFQDHPFKTREVINHLLDCFDFFGGIPQEMVIDQDKLLVVSENSGDIIYTNDFKYFIDELNIRMYVCRKRDPESKGKIENVVKYVKNNFLSIRDFKSIEEANGSLSKWLKRRGNGKISQATKQIPALLIEKEREHLRPVVNSIFRKESLIGREERCVNDKACISVSACGYQLPSKYRNQTVEVYITKQKIFVFDLFSGKEIVSYDLSLIPGKLICRREYKREKETALDDLKAYVCKMFPQEPWRQFVDRNFAAYPRYIRDQCIDAKRHFQNKEINILLMNQALEYCLENNTPSFLNLYDTYRYFQRDSGCMEESTGNFPGSSQSPLFSNVYKSPSVSSRDLTVYKELVSGREI